MPPRVSPVARLGWIHLHVRASFGSVRKRKRGALLGAPREVGWLRLLVVALAQ